MMKKYLDARLKKNLFWLYIRSMWLALRLVLFEKYTFVLTLFWWILAFIAAFAVHSFKNGSEFVVLGIAFFLQKHVYRFLAPLKSKLIYVGDRVEFAEDQENSYIQKFKSAKVLRKMRGEDVARTGLFSEELIPLYSHFYLVELEDKNAIIPYEWILSIDLEDVIEDQKFSD